MPLLAFGLHCSTCCPYESFVLTEEEQRTIRTNHHNSVRRGPVLRWPRPETVAANRRWADPSYREKALAGDAVVLGCAESEGASLIRSG
jgi:hypothetical protein